MTIVIIGTGLAGYNLAREIRKLDRAVSLKLITADAGDAYYKPKLSNSLAQGKQASDLVMADAATMAKKLDAEILTHTRVTHINSRQKQVTTNQGIISYDALVLATGAKPIRPPMAGDGADDVLCINNLADYARFRERLPGVNEVAVIGPGLIGCEFTNDLFSTGKRVTVIGPDPHPISTLLPESAGQALQSAFAERGVNWRLGLVVKAVEKEEKGYRLILSDNSELTADLVISAIGLIPDLSLAQAADLETQRGIVTNRQLATSQPDIYALGDSAEVNGFNLPFVMPLMIGSKALAKTLTGNPTEVRYPAMPVDIKTPAHPIVISPPPRGAEGEWVSHDMGSGVRALFKSREGELLGFALTGEAVAEKDALEKGVPDLF